MLGEQLAEGLLAKAQQLGVGHRFDRRGARHAEVQRQFAEEVAGAQVAQLAPLLAVALVDHELAILDDVHRATGVAFADDALAGWHRDRFERIEHRHDGAGRQLRERRVQAQEVTQLARRGRGRKRVSDRRMKSNQRLEDRPV